MLKVSESVKELEHRAGEFLENLIQQVPAIKVKKVEVETESVDRGVDILVQLNVAGHPHTLVCEVKANGQPRYVREGLLQLRNYIAHYGGAATPIFIAPYLYPKLKQCVANRESAFWISKGTLGSYLTASSSNVLCPKNLRANAVNLGPSSNRNPHKYYVSCSAIRGVCGGSPNLRKVPRSV